jgi:hypothetical protein
MWKQSGLIKQLSDLAMNISSFPFQTRHWSSVPNEEHKGETRVSYWQIQMANDLRAQIAEYSPGYKAHLWCSKGNTIFCLAEEMPACIAFAEASAEQGR